MFGPVVHAPANVLGLDIAFGEDDLDALILRENGVPGFSPQQSLRLDGRGTDMLVFSVRRGSAVIGMPDSIFGLPIEEGDLLVPPIPGGFSPFPGIFIAAESLGLATLRSGSGNLGADLNAADSLVRPMLDCDMDSIEDSVAIATGLVPDADSNGIPDSCGGPVTGAIGTVACVCTAAAAPCGNAYPAGCINGSGIGATLSGFGTIVGGGAASYPADDLVLTTAGMPGGSFALSFMGPALGGPFPLQNGLLCATGGIVRLGVARSPVPGLRPSGPASSPPPAGDPPRRRLALPDLVPRHRWPVRRLLEPVERPQRHLPVSRRGRPGRGLEVDSSPRDRGPRPRLRGAGPPRSADCG